MPWPDQQFETLFRSSWSKVLRSAHFLLGDRAAAEDYQAFEHREPVRV